MLLLRRAIPARSHRLLEASTREAYRRTSMATIITITILGRVRAPERESGSRTGIHLWITIKLELILS